MTIIIGWWALPLAITLASFVAAGSYQPRGSGYDDVNGAFFVLCAIIVSLVAWLVWAILA